jgi:methionyl-tRNA formyltransferase
VSRTAYFGTSDFAATVLRRLAESPHRPALVVTQPDRPRGRGRQTAPPPVAEAADELGIELLQAADLGEGEGLERIRASGAHTGALCAFGRLIREPLLSELPILNLHPSLLPRWRGAAPIERTLMAGDEETGVCVIRLTEGLDSGPVALREAIPVLPDDDFGTLSARLAEIGGELLVAALELEQAGALPLTPQVEDGVTYAEKIERDERQLDPRLTAVELERRVRALRPHIGAFLQGGRGERLGVQAASLVDEDELDPGRIDSFPDHLHLGCTPGVLALDIVQPPGGRPMPAADYLRGNSPPATAIPP